MSVIQVRHRLKRDHGIEGGIPVIFSLEKPKAKLLPFKGLSGEEENPSDYQVRDFLGSNHIVNYDVIVLWKQSILFELLEPVLFRFHSFIHSFIYYFF